MQFDDITFLGFRKRCPESVNDKQAGKYRIHVVSTHFSTLDCFTVVANMEVKFVKIYLSSLDHVMKDTVICS